MNYIKRIFQGLVIFGIIWLTIQNYAVKVDLKLFTKDVKEASVILIIFFTMIIGALIATFFAALKEYKHSRLYSKLKRENKKLQKEYELLTKDNEINDHNLKKIIAENDTLKIKIDTLTEVLKYPQINQIEEASPRLLD